MMRKYIMSITILFACSVMLMACSDDDHDDPNNEENVDDELQNNDDEENMDENNDHSTYDDNSETDRDAESNKEDEDKDEEAYESYVNERFGFSVEYPSSFEADYMPDNNDGIEVHDDSAVIIASGSHAGITEDDSTFIKDAESIKVFYDKALSDLEEEGYSISYKKLDDDWYVISYFDGTNNVYEKSIMDDDFIANLSIEYPADLQEDYGPMVERVSDTFKIP